MDIETRNYNLQSTDLPTQEADQTGKVWNEKKKKMRGINNKYANMRSIICEKYLL